MSYEVSEESDSDDGIEEQLGSVVSPRRQDSSQPDLPASSAGKKEPVQVPTEADGDDDSKSSMSNTGGGYVPSMGSMGGTGKSKSPWAHNYKASGKSVTGSLSMASSGKKPAYLLGDSDTDEDVEVPGAGNTDDKKDDNVDEADDFFEFYE